MGLNVMGDEVETINHRPPITRLDFCPSERQLWGDRRAVAWQRNGFPDRSRWVELLEEKTLQGRQHFCHAFPCKLSEGGCNTWQKLPGYVEVLRSGKWT